MAMESVPDTLEKFHTLTRLSAREDFLIQLNILRDPIFLNFIGFKELSRYPATFGSGHQMSRKYDTSDKTYRPCFVNKLTTHKISSLLERQKCGSLVRMTNALRGRISPPSWFFLKIELSSFYTL
jgi:hypothetical protein